MSINPPKHTSKDRRERAHKVRENAWREVQDDINRGRFAAVYQRMRHACNTAWRIETLQEP